MRNPGRTPIALRVELLSNGGPSDTVEAVLAAGEEKEVAVSFLAAMPGRGVPVAKAGYFGNQPGTGTTFTSDAMAAVKITAGHDGEATLLVESITAAAPAAAAARLARQAAARARRLGQDVRRRIRRSGDRPDEVEHLRSQLLGQGEPLDQGQLDPRGRHGEVPLREEARIPQRQFGPEGRSAKPHRAKGVGLRLRLSRHLRQMGAALRLLRGPRETARGAGPVADVLDDARPRRGRRPAVGTRRTPATAGWSWTSWSTSPAGDLTATTSPCTGTATARSTSRSARRAITSRPTRTASSPPACSGRPARRSSTATAEELWRWDDPRVSNVPSHFIFEVTTGGWDNNPVDDKQLPADYVVDYVRVWQRKDLASDADGCTKEPKAERK